MATTGASQFASLLRRFRRRSGLTQEELAQRAGLSLASVSLLERGLTRAPHRDTVELLVAALELAPDEAASFTQAARRARSTVGDSAPTAPIAPVAAPTAATPATPFGDTTPVARRASREQPTPVMPSYRLAPPLTPLLGREHEEAGIVHLLAQDRVRLLTLTGPAGVGKTRLALQAATTLCEREGFALALVDLVVAATADEAPRVIAQALGVRETGDLSLVEAMTAAIGARRLLLALDNFEHVLAAAPLCAALLGACPQAKALVTSRTALNVRGEHTFAVPPLPVLERGEQGEPPALADLERFGAVALFVERARAARPDFTLGSPARGRLVAAICARLGGLPLAIELAAAHMRHFTLEELAARLAGAPLELLVGGPRDLADHQRTMRSTVAWSYSLLSPDERRVFRTLGVFAGGATVEVVRRVAGQQEDQEDQEDQDDTVAACLRGLVDTSLARRMEPQGEQGSANGNANGSDRDNEIRYDLLVIVRAFALERLRAEGELETARRRLADYIVGLVEQVDPNAVNVQTTPLNRLMREHDNLRSVLEWLLERGEVLVGLRLGYRLRPFWESRGLVAEGSAWLERLLAQAPKPGAPDELDAQVDGWKTLVVMWYRLSHFQRAAEAAQQALALIRQQGDPGKVVQALHYLANPLIRLGEFERAEALLLERLAFDRLAASAGHPTGEMIDLINLADLRMYEGRYQEAMALEEEALALSRSLSEHDPSLPLILASLGEISILMDRPEEARDILRESQRVFEARDERVTMGLYNLGRASWRLGVFAEALGYLNLATDLSRRQDDVTMHVQELCVVAGVALDQGNLTLAGQALNEAIATQVRVSDQRVRWRVVERVAGYVGRCGAWEVAIRLYEAAKQGRSSLHDLVDPAERELRARDRAAALATLGPEVLAALEHSNDALTLPQALEMVVAALMET